MRDHAWPFVGKLSAPIVQLSEADFLGAEIEQPLRGLQPLKPPILSWRQTAPEPLRGNYRVVKAWLWKHCYGQHLRSPDRRHNTGGLQLLDADGAIVGGVVSNYAWLQPQIRERGLGVELIATYQVAFPEILRSYACQPAARSYTPAGAAVMRATYRLLVRRGAVEKVGVLGLTG